MSESSAPAASAPRDATPATCAHNAAVRTALPFGDRQDFADAARGFIATLPEVVIRNAEGRAVWDLRDYAFLADEEAPPTVNPSLWRQARLNMNNGLFQVCERIYQIRGFDISNMTIVEGARGIIIIDPMVSTETAKAGLELYQAHRGRRPVVAVIYSHSHADHYGGVRGVIGDADVASGNTVVIAPDHFLEEATSEFVLAGTAMRRRAHFQFGGPLFRGPRGQVDTGLGKYVSGGTVTLIPPTLVIRQPVEVHVIDGVEIVFQLTPDTEAKAEMHMFFPGLRALNLAENATHNLHNIYPLRGAQVRDALAWSKYLNDALESYAHKADVVLAQHHWPVWDTARLTAYIARQRDGYKYLHDQTLRLMNHGLKAEEIAEQLRLPPALEQDWALRGYYGTVRHNVKSIYQRYFGWFDSNAANLDRHPPVARAKRTIAYMGGTAAAIAKAREDFAQGDYRWVADVMSQAVYAEPDNHEARALAADAYEQLGYQAESATWRNAYLMGAFELRNGSPTKRPPAAAGGDMIRALTVPLTFDLLGVRLNGPAAEGRRIVINWTFPDIDERYVLTLQNSALTYIAGRHDPAADTTVTLDRGTFADILTQQLAMPDAVARGLVAFEGDAGKLADLLGMLDRFGRMFAVIEPLLEPAP